MLRARLLGRLEVELNGTAVDCAASQRPWALFAYLALASRPVARAELINTFWPDVLDRSARASLRSALWSLRRRIGTSLLVEGDHARLHDEGGVWVDAREFERLAASEPLSALELCRGELLEGLEEDWARSARERHRERVIELLEALAQAAEQRDGLGEAVALTRRQIEQDPFDEQAHRRLIERLACAGDRAGAIRTYRYAGRAAAAGAGGRAIACDARADRAAWAPRFAEPTRPSSSSSASSSSAGGGGGGGGGGAKRVTPARRPRAGHRRPRARVVVGCGRRRRRGLDSRRGGCWEDQAGDGAEAARQCRRAR